MIKTEAILIALVFTFLTYMAFGAKTYGDLNHVEYVSAYDGDTVTFNVYSMHPIVGQRIGVRINGIDTPELRTKDICERRKGIQARDVVRGLLSKGKIILLRNIQRGKYFRIVADIYVDGVSVANTLLNQGLAYVYTGGTKEKVNWCMPLGEQLQ